jgi:hypothetical protein
LGAQERGGRGPQQQPAVTGPWSDTKKSPDERAELLLKEMRLDEKITLFHGAGRGFGDIKHYALNGQETGHNIWSVTVDPLGEQLWGYSFSLDGVKVLDPGDGEYQRDGARYDNLLMILGPASDLWDFKPDIPHGTGRGFDHRAGFLRLTGVKLGDEAPHAPIPGSEAGGIHRMLPDGHGIATLGESHLDCLPVGRAGAGRRTTPRL